MKRLFILTVIAVMASAACSRENAGMADGNKFITIRAGIGEMTKVETSGSVAKFMSGDQLSLYAWTGDKNAVPASLVVDGVKNTLGTDGKWTPETQMLWADMVTPHYFLGIYPARTVTNFTADAFELKPADYEASDLLVATNTDGLKAQNNPVALSFDHMMAKLIVNLTFRNQWETEPTVTSVTATAKKTATVDYLGKLVTATGTAEAIPLTSSKNNEWSGLQVPQSGVHSITVTIDGKDYVYTHNTDIPLGNGKFTTVNLIVGRDQINLASEITITNWDSQGDAIEGDAEEKEVPNINGHEYVDLGFPSGIKWATCNVGATRPEDSGDFFAWGETEPYYSSLNPLTWKSGKGAGYDWGSYKWGTDANTFSRYTGGDYGTLLAEDDAAAANWGGTWRMPTKEEFEALFSLEKNWVTDYKGTGVNGYTFTGNGNTIFLPAAGLMYSTSNSRHGTECWYWSSSHCSIFAGFAWNVKLISGDAVIGYSFNRAYGLSVRPVSD